MKKKNKFIPRVLGVVSFCNTKWIDLCREIKSVKMYSNKIHRAYFSFDAIMGAFYFFILLIRTV